jgi:DNA-binding transcriptional MerR regulator
MQMLKIGELAKKTGLNPSKIRFFEKEGLLNLGTRQANGYRTYPIEAVDLILLILQAQEVGFTNKELKALLPGTQPTEGLWSHDALKTAVVKKMATLTQIQQKLADNQRKLQNILEELEQPSDAEDCVTRAMRILGVTRH